MKTTIEIGRKPYVQVELVVRKGARYLLRCNYQDDWDMTFAFSTNDEAFPLLPEDEKLEAIIQALHEQIEVWTAGIDARIDAESAAEAKAIRHTESFINQNFGRY